MLIMVGRDPMSHMLFCVRCNTKREISFIDDLMCLKVTQIYSPNTALSIQSI